MSFFIYNYWEYLKDNFNKVEQKLIVIKVLFLLINIKEALVFISTLPGKSHILNIQIKDLTQNWQGFNAILIT